MHQKKLYFRGWNYIIFFSETASVASNTENIDFITVFWLLLNITQEVIVRVKTLSDIQQTSKNNAHQMKLRSMIEKSTSLH